MAHTNRDPRAAATTSGAHRRHSLGKRGEHKQRAHGPQRPIAFVAINAAALKALPSLVGRWLPGGWRRGSEYVALNPRRADRHAGSFRINIATGRWADFATNDKGGDPIGLCAFLKGIERNAAAIELAREVGVDPYVRRTRQWWR